jgi:superoxide reductase
MSEVTFYRCNKCGNLVAVVNEGACTPQCCGQPMEKLVAGSTDAATEKHVPVAVREGADVKVTVGSVEHPMLEEHSIQWIALAQGDRVEIHHLHPGEKPQTGLRFRGRGPGDGLRVLQPHGLWKCEL